MRDLDMPRQPLVAREAAPVGYRALSDSGRLERIDLVKQGVPAQWLVTLALDMQLPRERLCQWLGLPRATVNRKLRAGERLSQDESERALGLARLVGQAQALVQQSGDASGFDAAQWVAHWLQQPNAALGARPPGEFMDTADGRELVASLLAQMGSGAYA